MQRKDAFMNKWNAIEKSIIDSKKNIQILKVDKVVAILTSNELRLTEESTLGAVILNTGGIVVDNWIRIYGSGKIDISIKNKMYNIDKLVIAEDIIGGLYLLMENGEIGYFAPDTLQIQLLGMGYNQFLFWSIQGDTDLFYKTFKWKGHEEDIKNISFEEGISFYPNLWAKTETERNRKVVSMKELVDLEIEISKQLH